MKSMANAREEINEAKTVIENQQIKAKRPFKYVENLMSFDV